MKKAIMPLVLVAILVTTALPAGCATIGPSSLVTEEIDFTDFTSVDVEGTFEVDITQSDLFSITISADSNFFDYIAVSKEGSTLRISLNPRHTFTDFTLQARTLKANITMPVLYGLSISGASQATASGFQSSRDFSLEISGASSLSLVDIAVGDTEFEISGASKVSGNIIAEDAEFAISGASQVELEGSASNLQLEASGASKVNLGDFPLKNADTRLSGASETTVNAKGRLDADLSAASRLYFQGNPTMGNISVSGASTIKHQ